MMTATYKKEQFILPSSSESIMQIEKIIHQLCRKYEIPEDAFGNILIAITEAVNNAVYHGNKSDKNKKVTIEFIHQDDQFVFSVKDEGNGFDYKNLPDPIQPENITKIGGRGIFIIHQLADKVEFADNGRTINIYFNIPVMA